MTSGLSYETAYGLFKRMPEFCRQDMDALGVSPQDLRTVAARRPWHIDNVDTVLRVLNCFIHGSTRILRITPLTMTAEYIAPLVCSIVAPENIMRACCWLADERQTGVPVKELAEKSPGTAQIGPVSRDQLWALCQQIMATDSAESYRNTFSNSLNIEIEKSKEQEATGKEQRKAG